MGWREEVREREGKKYKGGPMTRRRIIMRRFVWGKYEFLIFLEGGEEEKKINE